MTRINSRQKGARGERRAAQFLTDNGMPATRAARLGVNGGDDIVCVGLNIALEIKDSMAVRPGTKAMTEAMQQARALRLTNRLDEYGVLWNEARKGWRLTTHATVHGMYVPVTIHKEEDIVKVLKAHYTEPRKAI